MIVTGQGTDVFNPNCIRAQLQEPCSRFPCARRCRRKRQLALERGIKIFAARVDATLNYPEADFRSPSAIVLGSEVAGLSETWMSPEIVSINLPMLGAADSLNVSATAAVLFYEILRQRRG